MNLLATLWILYLLTPKRLIKAKVSFDLTLGVATDAPKYKPSSDYNSNYWNNDIDNLNDDSNEDDDDDDDDDDDLLAKRKLMRLLRQIANEQKYKRRQLQAKSFGRRAKKSSFGRKAKTGPVNFSGKQEADSNYYGIQVQEPISSFPIINMPFVKDPIDKAAAQMGMPNPLDAIYWRPKSCMVSATCGPRESCVNGKCVPTRHATPQSYFLQSRQDAFRPISFSGVPNRRQYRTAPNKRKQYKLEKNSKISRNRFYQNDDLQEKSETTNFENEDQQRPEPCLFFCDMWTNLESKI